MNSINFRTSHNIVIEQPLAGLGYRILACITDLFIAYMLFGFTVGLFKDSDVLNYILVVLTFFIYHLLSEYFLRGRSLGKMIFGLRVLSMDGKIPTLKQVFVRWSFRLIDILFSLGMVAMSSIYSSDYNQRLGDLMAGTVVIKKDKKYRRSLSDLLKLNELKSSMDYPLISNYTDEDMVLLKTILKRYREYPSDENYQLVNKLAEKIKTEINYTEKGEDPDIFLNKILNEYIVITR